MGTPPVMRSRFQGWRKLRSLLRFLRARALKASRFPPVGLVAEKDIWNTEPISRRFGLDRGQPIDRVFIREFIFKNRAKITGHVLEVADDRYTSEFGHEVKELQILHAVEQTSASTVVADLTDAPQLPTNHFDCVVMTQTLQFIYDVEAAVKTIHRILRPGGTALVTVAGISQISTYDMERWGDFWRFTTASLEKLFDRFDKVEISSYGNVLTAIAFLHGLGAEELSPDALKSHDPEYQVLLTIAVTK